MPGDDKTPEELVFCTLEVLISPIKALAVPATVVELVVIADSVVAMIVVVEVNSV